MNNERLATVRKISALRPIEKADRIEVAEIDGWEVVVKKGEFSVGDLCIYIEIDSWVPHRWAPFLTKDGQKPKFYQDIAGQRLKTVKLRGQISQGLVLPIADIFPDDPILANEGDDLTETLGVVHYEKPMRADQNSGARSYFPNYVPKTDQERVQNLSGPLFHHEYSERLRKDVVWEVTVKLDGSSMTVTTNPEGLVPVVCSRNYELDFDSDRNSMVYVARESGLAGALFSLRGEGYGHWAVQGEIMGPGIQGNKDKLDRPKLFVYDVYDIDLQRYMVAEERRVALYHILNRMDWIGMDTGMVDVVPYVTDCTLENYISVAGLLEAFSDIESIAGDLAEGVVFKPSRIMDYTTLKELRAPLSFKAINNKYLMKYGE